MKKLLGLTFVAIFMMSMAAPNLILKLDPDDCEDLAALDYELNGDQESADQVFGDCMDDITNEIKEFTDSL